MASLGQTFDATTVEPNAPREIIPAGEYAAQIVASEMRDTKSGSGSYLQLEFQITGGPCDGRKIWTNLNLFNANEKAVEIAYRDLSAICRAVGKLNVSDSEELHFLPMTIMVKVRPAGPDKSGTMRDAQNEIGGYKPATGATSAVSKPTPLQAAKPAKNTPPWRKAG